MDQGKPIKNEDGSWDTKPLYRTCRDPYLYEYVKYENPRTGGTQVYFFKVDKGTKDVVGYKIL